MLLINTATCCCGDLEWAHDEHGCTRAFCPCATFRRHVECAASQSVAPSTGHREAP
jgi:hypothetical protein